ncbi:indoleamine 2,3-dioxygenase 2 isoform X7 [Macaca thibetana thibetana]|uniref:indoleamine 2,3-dioxygenase 2 isoform X7 n=1 Tax=Macaca thibetana thibetana TaxID=257877 RepID=UPI0021BC857F|nr:indoleamine 2,3-dioxygenase 2 isoform X7 [Macaca thibetana thibetana]
MEPRRPNVKTAVPLSLERYHISEEYGFLLPDSLKELPDHYRPWMEIANKLPQLIDAHQLRAHVDKMPLLSCQFLKGHREQRLAHMVLSFLTMGYVWQEGEAQPAEIPGNWALVQAVNAILQPNQEALLQALQRLRLSIQDITKTLGQMHNHVDPDIFYSVIRIFLSGWKDNPAMPAGLMYEGVSKEPLKYSGGSAAQSTVLHAFDEFLGIRHSKESADFLYRMRDYMPPSHKAFIEDIHSAPSLRDYVLSSGQDHLLTAYNQCVQALVDLRSYHITMVTRYLITAAAKAKRRKPNHLPGPPQALEDRGTGGTAVMSFLKSVRDKTLESILHPHG